MIYSKLETIRTESRKIRRIPKPIDISEINSADKKDF
jgi:hypothetical protein